MRKITLITLFVIMSAKSFSQQTEASQPLTKEDYLKKSKQQKTAAWILAGGGVGMAVIAIATYNLGDLANIVQGDNRSSNTKAAFFIIGGVAAISSIPLFIASGRNKRKGMSMSFINESIPQIQKNSFVYRSVPSISLKINL